MNSRRATNEIKPNMATVSPSPMNRAVANKAHIIHQARSRRLNARTAAAFNPVSGWRLRNWPMTVATVSSPSTPLTRDIVLQSSIGSAFEISVDGRKNERGGLGIVQIVYIDGRVR